MEGWRLVRQRVGRVPTWRGCVLLLLLAGLAGLAASRLVHPFLAVTDRLPAEVLVVEGWSPDFVLRAALEDFRRGGYRDLVVTGGPLENGEPLSEYGSYAELGRATMARMSPIASDVRAVPAPPVKKDRTYASAVALREWLRQQGRSPAALNVCTTDAHARRTRLIFALAFGDQVKIGIIAVPDQRFDGIHWWRSSAGVRTVINEAIAYLYARFFFAAAEDLGK